MPRLTVLALLGVAACGAAPSTMSHPSVANRATDVAPLMVATSTYPSGLVIAVVDAAGVRTLATIPGVDGFGWVDPHTLFGLDASGFHDEALKLVRVVDAKVIDTVVVSKQDWPDSGASLLLSRIAGGTAWVSRCTKYHEEGSSNECAELEYLRLWPAPRTRTTKPPRMDVPTASSHVGSDSWPLPPSTKAPPDVKLSKLRRTAHADYGSTRDIDILVCERGTKRSEYPVVQKWDVASGFLIDGTRWVSQTPPIFELQATFITPVDAEETQRFYMRPCEPPMDDFAWLGDGRWASYQEPEGVADSQIRSDDDYEKWLGTWTLYDGERTLGTLRGLDVLRANRFDADRSVSAAASLR